MSDWTNIIDAATTNDSLSGAINTPIQLSSTFSQKSFDEFGEYDYARSGNPTRDAGEKALAQLEHGKYGYLFSTGMAAISSVLFTLSAGDHIVVSKHVYGGTFRVLEDVLPRWGIHTTLLTLAIWQQSSRLSNQRQKHCILKHPRTQF